MKITFIKLLLKILKYIIYAFFPVQTIKKYITLEVYCQNKPNTYKSSRLTMLVGNNDFILLIMYICVFHRTVGCLTKCQYPFLLRTAHFCAPVKDFLYARTCLSFSFIQGSCTVPRPNLTSSLPISNEFCL